jgi:predicted dehydrogenase
LKEEDKVCKVAMVGAGNMAREHLRAFAAVPGVVLAGLHSRTRSRADVLASEFRVAGVYDSVSELYEGTCADLVVVTVSETSMNPVSRACFEFPWAVLLEKPAGFNVVDAEEIYAAALAKDRKVFVALNRRFNSSTRVVLSDLAASNEPRFIKVQDQEDQAQALAYGHPKVVVDNWMYANSVHIVDYFRVLGRGEIAVIQPVIEWNQQKPGVVVARIEFDSGDIGLYECIWNAPAPWAVSVSTAQKRWELRPLERASYQLAGQRVLEPVPVHHWDEEFKPGFRLQAEMAVAAALGQSSDSPTLEDSLETMRLIKGIYSLNR